MHNTLIKSKWFYLAILITLLAIVLPSCISLQQPPTQQTTPSTTQPTGNRPPAITSLKAAKSSVFPGELVDIQVVASDPDGDSVNINWNSTGGKVNGSGYAISWQAPNFNGTYEITAIADDGKGGSAQNMIKINVGSNQSPQITSLVATPSTVGPRGSVLVTCTAVDPEGDVVKFSWRPQEGEITGEGSRVTWIAPNKGGAFNVYVIADDGKGGRTEGSVPITVALATKSTTINLTKEESGTVYSDGQKDKSFYRAGDNDKNIGYAACFSYNIFSLQRTEIKDARLVFTTKTTAGFPFTISGAQSLNGLMLWRVNYADSLPSYTTIGEKLNTQSSAMFDQPTSIDVTSEVGYLVNSGGSRFQMLLRFGKPFNDNGVSEWIEWTDVKLDVTYTEK